MRRGWWGGCRQTRDQSVRWNGLVSYDDGMKFLFSIYQDEDGIYIAECPSIAGCVSQGKSEAEAEANLKNAIRDCLAVRREKGLPLTVETREIEVPV